MRAQTIPLDEAFWFQEGPGVRKWQFTTSGIKLLNVGNICLNGGLDLSKTDRCLSREEVEKRYKHFLVDEGDLVIASSGISFDDDGLLRTRGVFVERSHLPLCLNTSTIRFKPKGENDLRYLRYWLDSHEFRSQITRLVTGSAQQNFGPSHLESIGISLPSLSEQQRIAGLLEQADRLRRTRRYALELSDTFLPAAFLELFGDPAKPRWPLVSLGEMITTGPQNGLYKPATAYGSGTPIVRIDAYQNGEAIDFTELKRVRLSPEEEETYGLAAGDFLINRVNSRSHLGKSTLVPKLPEPTVFESNMMRFRVSESALVSAYALKFLQTRFLNAQIQKQAKDASNQSSINQDDVEGFAILRPPLPLQQQFAALVERHQHLRATQREALRQAEHLFQSLLHRAFNHES